MNDDVSRRGRFPETPHPGIDSEALVGQVSKPAADWQSARLCGADRLLVQGFRRKRRALRGPSSARVNGFCS
jgi:hypothetical protein